MATDTVPAAVPGPPEPTGHSTTTNQDAKGFLASMVAAVEPARPTFDLAPASDPATPQTAADGALDRSAPGVSSASFRDTTEQAAKTGDPAGTRHKRSVWKELWLAAATRLAKGGGAANKRLDLAKARAQAHQVKEARTTSVTKSDGFPVRNSGGSGAGSDKGTGKPVGNTSGKGPVNAKETRSKGPGGSGSGGRGGGGRGPSGGSGSAGSGGTGKGPVGKGSAGAGTSGAGTSGAGTAGKEAPGGRRDRAGSGAGSGGGTGSSGGSGAGKPGSGGKNGKDGASGKPGAGPGSGGKADLTKKPDSSKPDKADKADKDSKADKRSKGSKGADSGPAAGPPGSTKKPGHTPATEMSPLGKSRHTGHGDGTKARRVVDHVKAYADGARDGWDDEKNKNAKEHARLDNAHTTLKPHADRPQADGIVTEKEDDGVTTDVKPLTVKNIDANTLTLGTENARATVGRRELRNFKQYERKLEAKETVLQQISDACVQLENEAKDEATDCQRLLEKAKGVEGGQNVVAKLAKLVEAAQNQAAEAGELAQRSRRAAEMCKVVLTNIQTRYAPLYKAVVDSDETKPAELRFYASKGTYAPAA